MAGMKSEQVICSLCGFEFITKSMLPTCKFCNVKSCKYVSCLSEERLAEYRSLKNNKIKPTVKGRPIDVEKRKRIISLAQANEKLSMEAIARHVGCSPTTVSRVFDDKASWK